MLHKTDVIELAGLPAQVELAARGTARFARATIALEFLVRVGSGWQKLLIRSLGSVRVLHIVVTEFLFVNYSRG